MRCLKNRIDYCPHVWWEVVGRKVFAREPSFAIRRSWKIGNYSTANEAHRARLERARQIADLQNTKSQ